MKTKQILMAGALALSMVLSGGMLTGCSNSSTNDTKTTEVTKKKEVKTIGKKTKDSKSLKITNNTGKKITVFETKSSSEESFSDNLLEDGDAVKNKEERTLYYDVKENDKLDVKVGLQDQDKTFVFKDVDTVDTKKVDVSLKEDKVNLDVTKKDGTTATLTPSEDSVKTEEEKKDESEVKQEEKKEETAKADSSNKSNTSESRRTIPLRLRILAQTRTIQVLLQSLLITTVQTQITQNQPNIHMTGLHSIRQLTCLKKDTTNRSWFRLPMMNRFQLQR